MNKLVILGVLIPLFVLITPEVFADPHHCYSYNECYNVGYGHGYADGQNGYSPVNACHNHSHAYCDGYNQGYRDAVPNTGLQQGESSQVNNNDVNVNQAQNAQSGSSRGPSYSYHGANPRCSSTRS